MTPQMLDCGTHAFRQGYYAARDDVAAVNPHQAGTFGAYDWAEGASAARAERKHDERMRMRALDRGAFR